MKKSGFHLFACMWVGFLCIILPSSVVANDVITLNSGEEISGLVTSENDTQLVIEVSNASGTIFTTRTVSKSEIKSIQRDTAEAKQERLAYEAVQRYRLNPDKEFTAAQYDAGTAACQKFLKTYPASEYAATVRQLGVQLQKEKEQVENGLVKFGNRWMSASEKEALASPRTHVVMKGESLRSIAKTYGVTVADLERANSQAKEGALKVGQLLVIPVVEVPPASTERTITTPAARRRWNMDHPQQPTQSFTGIFEAFDAHTITIRNRAMNVTKTFTITSESRIINHPVTELPSYSEHGIELLEFPDHITNGSIVWAAYREEGQTLTLINFAREYAVGGADGSKYGEGAEWETDFTVVSVVKGGLLSKDCLVVKSRFFRDVVVLENHPKQDSLAEGEVFTCHVRREGTFEGTDSKGEFRRLPRWVYVSDK